MYTAQGTIEKSHLLAQHQPLVRRIALQMMAKLPASVELDDLIQAGMMGLLDASSRYQDNRGAQFETFVSQRIRGAMLDELRASDWGSRGLRQSARGVEKAIQALEHQLGRSAHRRRDRQGAEDGPGGATSRCCRRSRAASCSTSKTSRKGDGATARSSTCHAQDARRGPAAAATIRWRSCWKAASATSWWMPSVRCPSATSCC